jgi:hypothetical protein
VSNGTEQGAVQSIKQMLFPEAYIHKTIAMRSSTCRLQLKKKSKSSSRQYVPKNAAPKKKQVKNRVSHLFPQNSQGKNLKNIKSIAALR